MLKTTEQGVEDSSSKWNHSKAEVGRDLQRSSCPSPLHQQELSEDNVMNSFPHLAKQMKTEMITRDSVKGWNETGLNGQRDDTSGYNTLQKRGIKQAKLCGTLKRI